LITPITYNRLEEAYIRLQGQRCRACNAYQMPPRHACRACRSQELQEHIFSGGATLYSFSELDTAPEGFEGPLLIALVDLDEGPRLAAQLADVDPEELVIGMELEMVTRRIRESGPEGCIVYGYKFRPLVG
jgi:uncharacterized protein